MADFSISDVAFTGFRVIRERPKALAVWVVIQVILAVAMLLLMAQTMAPAHACCHMMKTTCGHLRMPASSSCCHVSPAESAPYAAVNVKSVELRPVATIAEITSVFLAPVTAPTWFAKAVSSPPLLPPRSLSILRI